MTIKSRRNLRITREGWSFIFILCFIIIGSVLQQINLLIMLAGLMIAPFLFNWRIALNSIFQLTFERKMPKWAHAGQTLVVEWKARNSRRLMPAWGVKVTESIRRQEVNEKKATNVESLFTQIDPEQVAYSTYRCHFGQRGIYHFGPTRISSRFPLGLVNASYLEYQQTTLVVAPRLGTLTDHWSRKIDSAAVGVKSVMRRSGTSQDEFFGLRPWRSGDSRRAIHWRSTAKHGEPIVKQFEQQTDRDFAIILDLWQDTTLATPDLETAELAISFVATVVARVRQKVRGNIAIGICGHKQELFSDRVSQEFTRRVMGELAEIQPASENGIEEMLNLIGRSNSGTAPLIIISTRSRDSFENFLASFRNDPGSNVVKESIVAEVQAANWIQAGTAEFNELFQLSTFSRDDQIMGRKINSVASNGKLANKVGKNLNANPKTVETVSNETSTKA